MTISASRFFSMPVTAISSELEAKFYGGLKMRNNTFKLTQASRFVEIESAFGEILKDRARTIKQVLDVGVSTGVTTMELADFLRRVGSEPQLVATDLFVNATIVDIASGIRALADDTGWPLQFEVLGQAVRPWTRRLDYLTLLVVPRRILWFLLKGRVKLLVEAGVGSAVKMVNRNVERRNDIDFVEDNILVKSKNFEAKFDLVRAANVLNSNYFASPDLNLALRNVASYVRGPGSLVILTRTDRDQKNDGSLFELQEDGSFRVLARTGRGSEIEPMMLQQRIASQ